jgi:hypothetical protein
VIFISSVVLFLCAEEDGAVDMLAFSEFCSLMCWCSQGVLLMFYFMNLCLFSVLLLKCRCFSDLVLAF